MIVTADTNVFLYAFDTADVRRDAAVAIVTSLRRRPAPVGLQVCGEFFRAATRRLGMSPVQAAEEAGHMLRSYPTFAADRKSMGLALQLAVTGKFSFWDANLLAAADEALCDVILSEDMSEGTRVGRVKVVRPFEAGRLSVATRALLEI